MNIKLSALKVGLLIASMAFTAHVSAAAFIDNDTYTTDTVSGLDWLDVTATVNMSFNDVNSQLGVGGDYEGWHFAKQEDFEPLLSNYTGIPTSIFGNSKTYYNFDEVDGLIELLGATDGTISPEFSYYTMGFIYDDYLSGSNRTEAAIIFHYAEIISNADFSHAHYTQPLIDQQYTNIGSYLVRETTVVPAPPALILMLSGLLAIFGLTRRKAIKAI